MWKLLASVFGTHCLLETARVMEVPFLLAQVLTSAFSTHHLLETTRVMEEVPFLQLNIVAAVILVLASLFSTHRLLETTEVPYMLSQVLGLLFSTRRFSQTTPFQMLPVGATAGRASQLEHTALGSQ